MAISAPTRPRLMTQRRSFAIVASQYNAPYVQGLIESAQHEIEALAPGASVRVFEVPGAFEIPLLVDEVAARGNVHAIIALGVIIRGETEHADLIGTAVTQALLQCGLRHRIPVVHEVLLVNDEEQARARCLEPEMNRGTEAARAAVSMLQTLSEFRGEILKGRHGKTT